MAKGREKGFFLYNHMNAKYKKIDWTIIFSEHDFLAYLLMP